jgi:hypothetical protein
MDEAQKELEELLAKQETEGTEAPPPAGEAPPTPEEVAYYLNGKENKLPLQAEIALQHDGKLTKAPLSTILNHYRQRADLDKKSVELRSAREEWEKERGDIDTYRDLRRKYEDIQRWSEQNPEDFAYLYNMFENRNKLLLERDAGGGEEGAGQGGVPPAVLEKLAALENELGGLREFKSSFEQRQEDEADQQAYNEVGQEMEEFKKNFPEVNLDEQDTEGISLSKKILIHGVQRQIPDFKLAALDYLGPKLQDILVQRGRNEAVKSVRQDRQQGVVSRSVTPPSGKETDVDTQKNWADLHRDAKDELKQILGVTT